MTKEELKLYLIDEADYNEKEVEEMTEWGIINAYLMWEGIIGYTEDIIDTVLHVYGYIDESETI